MWKNILRALILLISFTILTGLIYPLTVTGLAQLFFPNQANGSLINYHGKKVGSALIGQDFKLPQYFHGRPSVTDYDGMASGGSNLAPTNRQLIKTIQERVNMVRQENQISLNQRIPSDLVTASASGLDPHISFESALIQAPRVAKIRKLDLNVIQKVIHQNTEYPFLGLFGTRRVNVLTLNLVLDSLKTGAD